jgi:toxin HigB-1
MIASFGNIATEDIFDGQNSTTARRALPRALWKIAFRELDQLNTAISLEDLRVPPGNKLEALQGDRRGQYSIRINEKYRICFIWKETDAENVEIVDYHK